MSFTFKITSSDPHSAARTGVFSTPHGQIHTPVFMPVGTKATVKTLTPEHIKELGAEIILANTYHLCLKPGDKLIKKQGGLHKWMHWDKPILTDSGGFQVFSLQKLRKVYDEGVEFQSPIDGGKKHFFTPRNVMHIQANLGADIIMAFDECAPADSSKAYAREALARTHRWAVECKKWQKNKQKQALFPIVQGVTYKDLRIESAKFMADLHLPGIAIGGLSVGESKQQMYETLEILEPHLPRKKPRYLMGVGSPEDLVQGVLRGIDMFDCVLPTRLARTGSAFLLSGRVDLGNARFRNSNKPLQPGCQCYCCRNFSQSYLHHLVKEKEILGLTLLTIHNIHFLLELMRIMRTEIAAGTLTKFAKNFLRRYSPMGSSK